MLILNVVGARPNLMKIAPIIEAINRTASIHCRLIHTGQHYDDAMSRVFFDELGIPLPDIYLGVGSGSHAEQTARVMTAVEKVLQDERPDLVLVVGDVNSTMACALTAAKMNIPVAHVEAGLRSYDRRMPEEINRIVTDAVSDFLFTTSREANRALRREGVGEEKIFFVGNVMIDTLQKHRRRAVGLGTPAEFGLEVGSYALLTLHRPGNVDDRSAFAGIVEAVEAIQERLPVLFPIHPRTVRQIESHGLRSRLDAMPNVRIVRPQGYLAFLDLMMHSRLVLTDSGGIQEETTVLGVPCLTLRENTERPETITEGTNRLVGASPERIIAATTAVLEDGFSTGRTPELWDGRAADRIIDILATHPILRHADR